MKVTIECRYSALHVNWTALIATKEFIYKYKNTVYAPIWPLNLNSIVTWLSNQTFSVVLLPLYELHLQLPLTPRQSHQCIKHVTMSFICSSLYACLFIASKYFFRKGESACFFFQMLRLSYGVELWRARWAALAYQHLSAASYGLKTPNLCWDSSKF